VGVRDKTETEGGRERDRDRERMRERERDDTVERRSGKTNHSSQLFDSLRSLLVGSRRCPAQGRSLVEGQSSFLAGSRFQFLSLQS
jgi:IS5 family transposase